MFELHLCRVTADYTDERNCSVNSVEGRLQFPVAGWTINSDALKHRMSEKGPILPEKVSKYLPTGGQVSTEMIDSACSRTDKL